MKEPGTEKDSKTNPDQISKERREFLKTAGVATAGVATLPNVGAYAGSLQSGTGAAPRTWNAKASDTVSVKDFGATGNGVTDDTAAIQAACDSESPDVYFPAGKYKTTSTIYIRMAQTLRGVPIGLLETTGGNVYRYSIIFFTPSGADKVAIKNTVNTQGNSIRDMGLRMNNPALTGVQFLTSYGNVIDNLIFYGTYNIGIALQDTYVCDLNRVIMNGCSIKSFGIYLGATNSIKISRFFTQSTYPYDSSNCMTGIAIRGSYDYSIYDSIFQGPTIGIDIADYVKSVVIVNSYNEQCLCPLRIGSSGSGGGAFGIAVIGGSYSAAISGHPQSASAGPTIYYRSGRAVNISGARIDEVPAPTSLTGPWSILSGFYAGELTVSSLSMYSGTMKDGVMRTGAFSPQVTIIGDQYGTFAATELILRGDGAYPGSCFGIRLNNAGAITTAAYCPAVITGSVSALLSGDIPVPASVIL
jgi:hypothetical protein